MLDQTKPVSAGGHLGKTMLSGPTPVSNCFLTDQRDFSDEIEAHSRMHSEIEIDVEQQTIRREYHNCDPTIEIDCDDGDVKCEECGATDDMKFSNLQFSGDKLIIQLELEGSSKNPYFKVANVKLAPNADYKGMFVIALDPSRQTAHLTFKGKIETYPAFEMYAAVNNGSIATIFRAEVVPGSTPANLFGPLGREVSGEAYLSVGYT